MGGPAFPAPYEFFSHTDSGNIICTEGMTLWDWYAAAALSGLLAEIKDMKSKHGGPLTEEDLAKQVGYFADAMLAERAKRTEGQS